MAGGVGTITEERGRALWARLMGEGGSIQFRDGLVVSLHTTRPRLLVAHLVGAFGVESCYVLLPLSIRDVTPVASTNGWIEQMLERNHLTDVRWMDAQEIDVLLTMGETVIAINYVGWRCG